MLSKETFNREFIDRSRSILLGTDLHSQSLEPGPTRVSGGLEFHGLMGRCVSLKERQRMVEEFHQHMRGVR